ncbi:hypothetical protein Ac2012v2_000059 [Leucoagaricus gongylophorus]
MPFAKPPPSLSAPSSDPIKVSSPLVTAGTLMSVERSSSNHCFPNKGLAATLDVLGLGFCYRRHSQHVSSI